MQRLALVGEKELICRRCGSTFFYDGEERRSRSKHSRMREISFCPTCRGEDAGDASQLNCRACGAVMDARGSESCYCERCYQASSMEAEALARQQANQAEALACERDELASKVEELTRLLQSRECQIKKLSSRIESLERDWRNATAESQDLRRALQNTELRLANAQLERQLVVSQYQDAGLQEIQAAVDALRREMRLKEQKLLERMVSVEKSLSDHCGRSWKEALLDWLRPQSESRESSSV